MFWGRFNNVSVRILLKGVFDLLKVLSCLIRFRNVSRIRKIVSIMLSDCKNLRVK